MIDIFKELQMRQGTHRAEKQDGIKQLRKENETIRLPIAGTRAKLT